MSRRLRGSASTPVVLPHVIIRPDGVGTVTVTLDGQPVCDAAIPRMQLGEAISQIVDQLGTAVRVEVHELDGTINADILLPPPRQSDAVRVASGSPGMRESA